MKRGNIILILLLSLMIIPFASAVEISLSQENYQPGELLQAEITGNFLSLTSENILIYQGNKVHSTPVISDLTHQDNIYYFYAVSPITEGNYSIRIEDAEYTELGKTKEDTIIQNFTIQNTNESALSINPGFVLTSEDFTINVKSLKGNQEIIALLDATAESKKLSLVEDLEETAKFSIEGITKSTILSVGDYNIPVFVIEKSIPEEPEIIENKTELSFLPEALTGNVTLGYAFKVIIANTGIEDITIIKLSTDSEIILGETEINSLESNKQFQLTLVIPQELTEKEFTGTITASFENQEINLPFNFEIITDAKKVEVIADVKELASCEGMGGKICGAEESCSVDTESSTDGPCCTGTCEKEKTSNTGTIIGFLILAAVIGIIVFFYFKGKKKLKPKSTEEILKEKQGAYAERMKSFEPREVSGSLSKD